MPAIVELMIKSDEVRNFIKRVDKAYELAMVTHFKHWHDMNCPIICQEDKTQMMAIFNKLKFISGFFLLVALNENNSQPAQCDTLFAKTKEVKHCIVSLA